MTASKTTGEFKANRQRVKNTLTQAAFDILGKLLSGTAFDEYAEFIALVDGTDTEITRGAAVFSTTANATGVVIEGSFAFSGASVTSDVHKLRLVSNQDRVMAEATLGTALPSGQGVVVTRTDTVSGV